MKISCDLAGDLLPLYKENLLSQESHDLVVEHLNTCEKCKASFDESCREIYTIPKKIKPVYLLFYIHFIAVLLLGIVIQVYSMTYFNKYIFFTNYKIIQSLILALYLLAPLVLFVFAIIITKNRQPFKIMLYLILLILGAQLLTILFIFIFSSTSSSIWVILKNYINSFNLFFVYNFIPILIGFIFEFIYKVAKHKIIKRISKS